MITEHHFSTIYFFLGVFLCVTYLLSFALAFHDKEERKANPNTPALDGGLERNHPPSDQRLINKRQKTGANDTQAKKSTEIQIIFFAEGFASVDIDMELKAKEIKDKYKNDPDPNKLSRVIDNNEAMTKIKKQIDQYNTNQRIRITLMGHSNDRPTMMKEMARYKSNYELSDARARQVLWHLTKELGRPKAGQKSETEWHNIEWLLAPISNEEIFIRGTPQNCGDNLCVEVSITPITAHLTQRQMQALEQMKPMKPQSSSPRKLELLDYIYFTIYTITTTGYGDIKPMTGYAKFGRPSLVSWQQLSKNWLELG